MLTKKEHKACENVRFGPPFRCQGITCSYISGTSVRCGQCVSETSGLVQGNGRTWGGQPVERELARVRVSSGIDQYVGECGLMSEADILTTLSRFRTRSSSRNSGNA